MTINGAPNMPEGKRKLNKRRTLRQVSENEKGISRFNNFVGDTMEKIANKAGRLTAFTKKHTSREI